jgi:hypothetical protein
MADKLVKIVGRHVKGCSAVKLEKRGDWDTCWGPIAWGDRGQPIVTTVRKHRRSLHWVQFLCNNTQCAARLYVEANFILAAEKRSREPQLHEGSKA